MKNWLCSILFLLSAFWLKGQTPYQPDYSNFKAHRLSIFESENNYNTYLEEGNSNSGLSNSEFDEFCELTAFTKRNLVTRGQVYQNIEGVENYLQNLVTKILKANDINIDCEVILTRGQSSNAFAMHGSELFVQIGLLANVQTEAQLAFVLAHELGHLVGYDPIASFERSIVLRKRKFRRNKLGTLLTNAEYSRFQESRADSFAIYAIKKAGLVDPTVSKLFSYVIAIDSIYNGQQRSLKISDSKKSEKDSLKPIEQLLRSHPESFKRARFIDSIVLNEFKIDKELALTSNFLKAHQIAQYEILHLLLNDCEFEKCSDKAFRFYLTDDKNVTFIYYLLEALRRQMYVDSDFSSQKFLTTYYKDYLPKDKGIFENLQLLIQSEQELDNISKHAYIKNYVLNDSTAKTNKKVFEELAELGVNMGINEASFSLALYNYARNKKSSLKDYVKTKSGNFNDFASQLLKDELIESSNAKKLVLVDDINYIDEKSYGYRILLKTSQQQTADYMSFIDKFSKRKLKEYEITSVSNLAEEDYGKLMILRECMSFIAKANKKFDLTQTVAGSTKKTFNNKKSSSKNGVDLFVLCPELWMAFDKYNLQSIDYISTFSIYFQPKGLRLFQAIYPLYIYENVIDGSPINQFWLTKTSFNPSSIYPYSSNTKEVHYKINKYYYANSLYYLINE